MPAKLLEETEAVKWRVRSDDLDLLRFLHETSPGGVNAAVRDILHAYCEHVRRKRGGIHS